MKYFDIIWLNHSNVVVAVVLLAAWCLPVVCYCLFLSRSWHAEYFKGDWMLLEYKYGQKFSPHIKFMSFDYSLRLFSASHCFYKYMAVRTEGLTGCKPVVRSLFPLITFRAFCILFPKVYQIWLTYHWEWLVWPWMNKRIMAHVTLSKRIVLFIGREVLRPQNKSSLLHGCLTLGEKRIIFCFSKVR